jgi:prepilin-type N-terminal cleavage/methylation domain-containing protein
MEYGKRLSLHSAFQGEAGFTLVELLLALFLFALIAGVIFAAFAAVASGVEKGRQSIELYRVGRVALLYMAQEIAAAMPPPDGIDTTVESNLGFQGKKNWGGSGIGQDRSGIGQDRIEFLTIPYRRYSDKVPAYDLCRVAYYVADNQQSKTALFRVADNQQSKTALFREEDCSNPGGEEDERRERATRLELTDLAVGLEITYYDAEQAYEEWPPTTNAQNPLPCRVRLALTLRDMQQRERAFITTVALPMMQGSCDNEQTRRVQTRGRP